MRAVIATDFDTEPELAELPVAEPGPGEVLVRLEAAGVNPFDWKVVDGALRGVVEHAFPLVLGSDGAGVVERVGPGVTGLAAGDRVFGQFMDVERGRGSYAEFALAPAEGKLALLPTTLPFDLAAALPTAGAGAHDFVAATEVAAGQIVLVNGASGGVGQAAVQVAAAKGADVIATTDPATAAYLREIGATEIVDFTEAPTVDQVLAAHPDGIDAVVDLVSGPADTGRVADVLRPGGTIVSANGAVDVDAIAERGLHGANLYAKATPETLAALAEAVAGGELKVRIDFKAPLERAPAALERSRAGNSRGKTVLTMQENTVDA
ncbi:NADP-dependent oxidoreductase [Glycomyces arizonensis]|uniref:NADP-dependent oxidoreductase n=1 Tax=Glycomyces arizonensis TaxID=256035 RepID=UPI0003FA2440|nr:NADP-dependent oxidoreductase [Glycomyces arizonensis]